MKDNFIKLGIKNFSYVFFAQMVSYLLGFFLSFLLPGVLGVKNFGYYQVYAFYITYVAILEFGFYEGIYLRYGNYDYHDLPHELFRSQFRIYMASLIILAILTSSILIFEKDPNKQFAFVFVLIDVLLINTNSLLSIVNQVTNRIKKYSFAVLAEKIQILVILGVFLYFHLITFQIAIVFDCVAKFVVFLINIYNCKEIIFGKATSLRDSIKEYYINISVGIKLQFANIMGMLVLGIGTFMLERFGSVSEFGLYSFAVNSLELAMMFVSAVSLILYPLLCRIDKEKLPDIFLIFNRLLCTLIFVLMLIYYPLVFVIKHWLSKYTPVLDYLYLLFPIVIMQSKINLLINTYYKSLREEKSMFLANSSSVIMFLVLAVPAFCFYPSIQIIVWATLITFVWRCYASELFLKKKMGITSFVNIIEEIAMASVFIFSIGFIKGIAGFAIYLLFTLTYIFIHRKSIIQYSKKIVTASTLKIGKA